MEAVQQDKQVSIIQKSIEIFRSAPEVLKANQERTAKAVAVAENILDQWKRAWGIEDEESKFQALAAADERSNKFLVNSSKALAEEKEARAAITQMMDEFKKMFTAAEAELDKAKDGTVTNRVQSNRDSYAKELAKVQERKRKEAEEKAAKDKERVNIKYDMEEKFRNQFNDFLLKAKTWLQGQFNAINLRTFADDSFQVRLYKPEYKKEAFDRLHAYATNPKYHDDHALKQIHDEVKESLFDQFSATYISEMAALQQDLIDKIPSKRAELEEQARIEEEAERRRQEEKKQQEEAEARRQEELKKAADDAAKRKEIEDRQKKEREDEQARILAIEEENSRKRKEAEDEQRRREEDDRKRLEQEAKEKAEREAADAASKKAAEETMVLFEQEAELSDVTATPATRQGCEIQVLHQVGYMKIFAFWFEREGKSLPVEKIGNTKLDQMKAWCEKHAHKTGEKIEDKFLRYEETYKAVNKK